MEKLLAIKGIKSVCYTDNRGIAYKYFYTDQLLAGKIVIEFFELQREGDEEEELVEEEGYAKHETSIMVYTVQEKICYQFTMLFDTRSYVPTLYLYRTILDLVELIKNSDGNSIIENLEDAADASLNSNNCHDDDKLLKNFNNQVNNKIKQALKLIEQTKVAGS